MENYELGEFYSDGFIRGLIEMCPNFAKALEYHKKAGEMGDFRAYEMIGGVYIKGMGVPVDRKKAWNTAWG